MSCEDHLSAISLIKLTFKKKKSLISAEIPVGN